MEELNEIAKELDSTYSTVLNSHAALVDALRAIRARIHGDYDHPALKAIGPLRTTNEDILYIVQCALALAEGKE